MNIHRIMKKSFIAAIAVLGLAACAGTTPKSVKGTVADASMNTVTIKTGGGETLTFSTMDADKSGVDGLLLGAPICVEYKGKLTEATPATKISTCSTYSEAVGRWVIVDPLDAANVMGIELQVEGAAQSINMATLVCSSWELTDNPGEIIVKGQSIGNGQTIELSEKAVIAKDTEGNLTLNVEGTIYTKEN